MFSTLSDGKSCYIPQGCAATLAPATDWPSIRGTNRSAVALAAWKWLCLRRPEFHEAANAIRPGHPSDGIHKVMPYSLANLRQMGVIEVQIASNLRRRAAPLWNGL